MARAALAADQLNFARILATSCLEDAYLISLLKEIKSLGMDGT